MRKTISAFLSLVLLFTMLSTGTAFATNDPEIDMSMANEEAWAVSGSKTGLLASAEESVYLPEGAVALPITYGENCMYVTYDLDGVRYIVSYFSNGQIAKTAKAANGDIIYYAENTSDEILQYDSSVSEENSINSADARWGEIPVYPLMYTDVAGTRPFNARIATTTTVNLPALASLGYSANQTCRVYESMDYFEEERSSGTPYAAGTALTVISIFWNVSTVTATGWLRLAGIALTGLNKIDKACKPINTATYIYQGGKEVGIYDPTYHNSMVEVLQYWSPGRVALGSSYSSSGYSSYTWTHIAESTALKENNTALIAEAREIYNGNVQSSGWWRFGAGQFGY